MYHKFSLIYYFYIKIRYFMCKNVQHCLRHGWIFLFTYWLQKFVQREFLIFCFFLNNLFTREKLMCEIVHFSIFFGFISRTAYSSIPLNRPSECVTKINLGIFFYNFYKFTTSHIIQNALQVFFDLIFLYQNMFFVFKIFKNCLCFFF